MWVPEPSLETCGLPQEAGGKEAQRTRQRTAREQPEAWEFPREAEVKTNKQWSRADESKPYVPN